MKSARELNQPSEETWAVFLSRRQGNVETSSHNISRHARLWILTLSAYTIYLRTLMNSATLVRTAIQWRKFRKCAYFAFERSSIAAIFLVSGLLMLHHV